MSDDANITIYHNPRCSKSRATLELLRARGVEPIVVGYLEAPLDGGTLASLANQLGVAPHQMLRTREPAYREAGLTPDSSDRDVFAAIVAHPILLERPIVVRAGGRAVFGRPPENVLALLEASASKEL